jgi:RNA polymerase sigma-70 factor (ECF subfamily)
MDGLNDLLRRARAGEAEAWQRLKAAFEPHLWRVAQSLLGRDWPQKSCRDLIQETWLRVLAGLAEFRGASRDEQTAAVFRAWLAQTMHHLWCNEVRDEQAQCRRAPGRVLSLPAADDSTVAGPAVAAPDPTPSRDASRAELRRLVHAALERIDDPEIRAVLRLHYLEELPLREVAARLQLTYDQVRGRCHAGEERLKVYLEHLQ